MTQSQFNFLFNKGKELMAKTKDPVHDLSHVERVLNNALEIKKLLSADKQAELDDKILILAALWHDVSYCFYKVSLTQYFLEAKRTVTIAKKYFQAAGLENKEADLINDIILHHPLSLFGFLNKKRSYYHQIIQDADFFDNFNEERIEKAEETAPQYFFRTMVMKVMKPLFFQFLIKHKKWFLNLSDIIKSRTFAFESLPLRRGG